MALEMELSPVTEEAFKKYFRELLLEQVNEIRQDEMKSRPYLNKKDMAAWLGVSKNTLDKFIKAGLKGIRHKWFPTNRKTDRFRVSKRSRNLYALGFIELKIFIIYKKERFLLVGGIT